MIEVRLPRIADAAGCAELAALAIGEERAGAFIRSHMERHHLVVAEADGQIVGFLAYRTDWFQCTFVTLVVVREEYRRKGIAREFFKSVEVISPTPRLFSSTEETNGVSIRMHTALGFTPSGHIDNLPQGTRELLFYRRIPPRRQRLTHTPTPTSTRVLARHGSCSAYGDRAGDAAGAGGMESVRALPLCLRRRHSGRGWERLHG